MDKLPSVNCPECNRLIVSEEFVPNARGGAKRASGYDSCLRRCETCGIGLSNANTDDCDKLTIIYRDPFINLPDWLKIGYKETLSQALNVKHRSAKLTEFHSSHSEDNITWTIFKYLQHHSVLIDAIKQVGVIGKKEKCENYSLLLWGVPVPNNDLNGCKIQDHLITVLNKIGEKPRYRSEPDVLIDLGESGIIFIEVKHLSPNEKKPSDYSGWITYIENTSAFTDTVKLCDVGLYELTRNWRIAWDLAEERSMKVINLGPTSLFSGQNLVEIMAFKECLNIDELHEFIILDWQDFFTNLEIKEDWLRQYLEKRRII
jgi:hypothetical protein